MKWTSAGALMWASVAVAQPMGNMPGMAPAKAVPGAANAPMPESTQAYRDSMRKMMGGMDAPYTGDADHDFVTHMMPHHQGAIDMAVIELKYGSDPKIKQLAGKIVAAQEREIDMMQKWLDKHPAGDKPHGAQWK